MKSGRMTTFILLSIFTLLMAGCTENMKVSAEEIMHQAIEAEKDVTDHIGISEMKMYTGEELVDHMVIEMHVSDNKNKVFVTDKILGHEVESLNDGDTILIYDKGNQEAYELTMDELDNFPSLNPKEQFIIMMDSMKETHTYELIGEEEILGRKTYHIQLKPNEANSLMGDTDIWVDKKTWFIMKYVSETGDMRTELTYTEIDFSPEIPDDTFTIDIPDDIKISNLKEMEEEFGPETVTLEESAEALGQPFLIFSEEDADLVDIQMYDFTQEFDRYEFELTFHSKDGVPLVNLSVFPTPDDMPIYGQDETIRGNPAEYEEVINGYLWDEDGIRYSLLPAHPDLTKEEIIELTENMVLVPEN